VLIEQVDMPALVQPHSTKRSRFFRTAGVYVLPGALLLAALWLPFGFSLIGLIEEWDLLGWFTTNGVFLYIRPGGPIVQHILRPFYPLSLGIAYLLDSDSFFAWHLLMLVALLVKGAAMTHLVGRATRSYKYGVMAAVLLLLYPADTMQLSFRSISINWAIACALLGAAFLYGSFELANRLPRYVCALIGVLLILVACLTYEAAVMIAVLPPAFLIIGKGLRPGLRRFFNNPVLAGLCFLGPLLYLAFVVWASRLTPTYQAALLPGDGRVVSALVGALPKLFSVGAVRGLVGGWIDAIRILATEYSSYWYLLVVTILSAALSALLVRIEKTSGHLPAKPTCLSTALSRRLIAVGFAAMLLGYAPFMVSPSHMAITQRTYLWATPGAVLVWIGVLGLLARFIRTEIVFAALAVLGFSAQLYQFHHYVALSDRQRSILTQIVEKFDGNLGNKTLLVLDGTNSVGSTWMFLPGALHYTLSYLYGYSVGSVQMCRRSGMEWQLADGVGRKGICIEDENGWTFRYPTPIKGPGYVSPPASPDMKLNKSDVIVVSVDAPDKTQSDVASPPLRSSLESGHDTIARRYRGILKDMSWHLHMFKDEIVGDSYKWSFGKYWNLDIPTRGSGWRETEWAIKPWWQYAFTWKTNEDSCLYFDFIPREVPYRFTAHFEGDMSLLKDSQVRLNGESLSLLRPSGDIEADIPSHVLRTGENSLCIRMPVNPDFYGFSMRLVNVEIARK
jgi:hypothetical protein